MQNVSVALNCNYKVNCVLLFDLKCFLGDTNV